MGIAKRYLEEGQARGWYRSEKFVCPQCISEPSLREIVREKIDSDEQCLSCSALGAAPFDILTAAYYQGVMNEYQDIDTDYYPIDKEANEYFLNEPLVKWDLICSELNISDEDAVQTELMDCLADIQYIDRNWQLLPPHRAFDNAWENFKESIMHRTRFVFWLPDPQEEQKRLERTEAYEDYIEPKKILFNIAQQLEKFNVITTLNTHERFWRFRSHSSPTLVESEEELPGALGTAPIAFATKPNRMSPAGIPMFYGSLDKATAVAEVRNYADKANYLTGGAFTVSEEITVVDFSKLPPNISVFHPTLGHLRRELLFLNSFAEELSQKIKPEEHELKYVATQVVTEFLLKRYQTSDGKRPQGILYKSSIHGTQLSAVFDIDNVHCAYTVPTKQVGRVAEPFLLLDPSSVHTIAPSPDSGMV